MDTVSIHPDVLKFLVYTSEAVERFEEDDLEQLLIHARHHNHAAGISGILLYRNHRFIQFLEGTPTNVDALMERIRIDQRHANVRIVLEELTLERQFEDWTMGYQASRETVEALPEGFRDSFADIEQAPDRFTSGRAAKELALWFKVRSRQASPVNA